jgi:hypothetical protein
MDGFGVYQGPGKLPGILIGVPVVRREFDAPEPRARREKFNSDTHALAEESPKVTTRHACSSFGGKIGED